MNKQREGHLGGVFISGNKGLSWRNRAGILIDVSGSMAGSVQGFTSCLNTHTHINNDVITTH